MSWLGVLGGFTQKQITQALPKGKNNAILNHIDTASALRPPAPHHAQ